MSAAYFEAVIARRSLYALSASSPIPDAKIVDIINKAVLHSPSSFNSQSSRVLVVFGAEHKKVWGFAKEAIKAIVPAEAWPSSEARLTNFENAYGTALLFEDRETVSAFQQKLPDYAERFPVWAQHANGILAHVIWTALEAEGLGANLQHYNPLIDAKVAAEFGLPASWELAAQVVFGKNEGGPAAEKVFAPLENRVKVFGASA